MGYLINWQEHKFPSFSLLNHTTHKTLIRGFTESLGQKICSMGEGK